MIVKVCGITRVQDAETACQLGAAALGFIFWPKSPRFLDPYRARAIVRTLPPFVTPIGVFVNQPPDYVNGVASRATPCCSSMPTIRSGAAVPAAPPTGTPLRGSREAAACCSPAG
jgi:hypothetical protein